MYAVCRCVSEYMILLEICNTILVVDYETRGNALRPWGKRLSGLTCSSKCAVASSSAKLRGKQVV